MKPLTLNASRKMKKTPIGEIPVEWEVLELQHVTQPGKKIVYGIVQAGPNISDGVPYIKSTDVGGAIDPSLLARTSEIIAEKYKRAEVEPGDIVFSLRGNIGETSIVPDCLPRANLTQGTARISVNNRNHNRFIEYILHESGVVRRILVAAKGSTFHEISLNDLRRIHLALPPLPEQRAIAGILDEWSTTIDQFEHLVIVKRRLKSGLMQHLLTGKRRFPAFDKGRAGGWKTYHLGDLLKEVTRPISCEDDKQYDLISIRRRSGGLFNRESLYGREILTKNLSMACAGDFLISKMQVVHGASGLVTSEFDGKTISGSYITLAAKDPKLLDVEFFNYLSQLPFMYRLALVSSYGVHIEKMTFNLKDYLHKRIRIPPTIEEQRRIVGVLDDANREIQALERELAALREQKRGLMQKLLTGKIRVRV